MFKKIILALVCLSFTLSGSAAKLTATLQSGDKITPFYGANAFVEAYNAAVNGDVITLSPGAFNATTIEKSITVVGTYAFSDDLSKTTQFSTKITVNEDNVTLEGIRFTDKSFGLIIKGADNLTINRCYIAILNDEEKTEHKYHNNTILNDCYICDFRAMSLSQNAVLRNCSVYYFLSKNKIGNSALIENCNVSRFARYEGSLIMGYEQPYAIYRNCCLGLYKSYTSPSIATLSFSAPSEFHNNCFYETYQDDSGSYYAKSWSFEFGSAAHSNNVSNRMYSRTADYPANGSFTSFTKNGVSYGPAAHKSYPAIPSITSSEIDTKTDAEGNLHVKITATAND